MFAYLQMCLFVTSYAGAESLARVRDEPGPETNTPKARRRARPVGLRYEVDFTVANLEVMTRRH